MSLFRDLLIQRNKVLYSRVLEYIQNDGTSYIEFPHIFPDQNTIIECVAEGITNAEGTVFAAPFGAGADGSVDGFFVIINTGSGNVGRVCGNLVQTESRLSLNTKYLIRLGYNDSTINDEILTQTGTQTNPTTLPLRLFKLTHADYTGVCRISCCRVYNKVTGTLLLDAAPVLDLEGNPCFWDKVENRLYYNSASSGSFTYKEWDYTNCDYIHTDGNAYINTYNYGYLNTAIEAEFRSTNARSQVAMGARTSATSNAITMFHPGSANTTTIVMDFGDYRETRFNDTHFPINAWYRAHNDKTGRWGKILATGTVYTNNVAWADPISTPTPIYVGFKTPNYTATNYNFIGDYRNAQIYDNGVLIRNYKPVIDGNNVGAFYDECLNTIWTSIGSSEFEGHFVSSNTDYTVVHYLQSSGTQYIDTGYTPSSSNIRMKTNVTSLGSPTQTAICGSEEVGTIPRWIFVLYGQKGTNVDTTRTYPLTGDWNNKSDGFLFTNGKTLDIDWVTSSTSTTIKDLVTGTSYSYTFEEEMNYTNNTTSIKLFQNSDTQRSTIRMRRFSIEEDGKFVKNFISVLNGSTPGMFDTVNKQFKTNAGTGSFTTG